MIYRTSELNEMHKKNPHSKGDVAAGYTIAAALVLGAAGLAWLLFG